MGFCNFFFFVILERRDAEPGFGFEKRGLGPAPGCLGTGAAGKKKKKKSATRRRTGILAIS